MNFPTLKKYTPKIGSDWMRISDGTIVEVLGINDETWDCQAVVKYRIKKSGLKNQCVLANWRERYSSQRK